MHVGETEFLDVLDENGEVAAQYQLDVVKIKTSKAARLLQGVGADGSVRGTTSLRAVTGL